MQGKIIRENIVHHKWGKYAELTVEYTRTDGKVELQIREVQDSGHGAAVMLFNRQSRTIVLVKQFRIGAFVGGHHDGVLVECVAGLVEKNEDPAHTIVREVLEETGMIITRPLFLYEGYASPGAKTEKIYYFIAEYVYINTQIAGGHEDEQEDIQILEVGISEAWQMVKDGRIQDSKTIVLIQHLLLHIFASEPL